MKKTRKKSDLAMLFELAAGQKLEDYLHDRATVKHWRDSRIAAQQTMMIKAFFENNPGIVTARLFEVNSGNVQSWLRTYGIKYLPWREAKEYTKAQLARLNPRERVVIKMRNGMGDWKNWKPATLDLVGKALKVSRERAHQIERAAIAKMEKVG